MENNKMIVLVTGGSGLIGCALRDYVKELNNKDEEFVFLSSKDAKLENMDETVAVFQKYKPTHVIHLAVKYCGIYSKDFSNFDNFYLNDKINSNVFYCCKEFKIKKMVCCLSGMVFSQQCEFPVNEDNIQEGHLSGLVSGYVYSKRLLETYCRVYNECLCEFLSVPVIIPNAYGPNDIYDLKCGRVVPSLVHKAYLAKIEKKPLVLFGTGRAQRQFVYSFDAAKAFYKILKDYNSKEPIIVSPDIEDEISILKLAKIVKESMKLEEPIDLDTSYGDGMIRRTMSNQRLKNFFPEFKFTSVEEGISKTVEWFIKNYDTLKK